MCLSQGRYVLKYDTVLGSLEGNNRNLPKANGLYDQLWLKLNPPTPKKEIWNYIHDWPKQRLEDDFPPTQKTDYPKNVKYYT